MQVSSTFLTCPLSVSSYAPASGPLPYACPSQVTAHTRRQPIGFRQTDVVPVPKPGTGTTSGSMKLSGRSLAKQWQGQSICPAKNSGLSRLSGSGQKIMCATRRWASEPHIWCRKLTSQRRDTNRVLWRHKAGQVSPTWELVMVSWRRSHVSRGMVSWWWWWWS